jgi:probable 2-oxoglutarate dehydrogenase E1 component DHKTD1
MSGIIDSATSKEFRKARVAELQSELYESVSYVPTSEWDIGEEKAVAKGKWTEMVWPTNSSAVPNPDTGVVKETLLQVGKASVEVPTGFVSQFIMNMSSSVLSLIWQTMHERLKRHIGARTKSLESGIGINWGTAEV